MTKDSTVEDADYQETSMMSLDELRFLNFDARSIANLIEGVPGASFTANDHWRVMPRSTVELAATSVFGLDGHRYAVIAADASDGTRVETFIGSQNVWLPQFETTSDDSRGERLPDSLLRKFYLYADVVLPFSVPHIRVLPEANAVSKIRSQMNSSVGVELEGDFSDFYTVETAQGNEVTAYQILPPDTMLRLLTTLPEATLEYENNHIFIGMPLESRGGSTVTSFGRTTEYPSIFQDDWASFHAKVSSMLLIVPELVDSARTARIDAAAYSPMQVTGEKRGRAVRSATRKVHGKILLALPIALLALIGLPALPILVPLIPILFIARGAHTFFPWLAILVSLVLAASIVTVIVVPIVSWRRFRGGAARKRMRELAAREYGAPGRG